MKVRYGILMAGAAIVLASCAKDNTKATIWTAPATEKIMLDHPGDDTVPAQDLDYELTMVKGEYESFQIMITPDADTTFNAKAKEFKNGSSILNPDGIEIYREKYVEVQNGTLAGAGLPLGWYPDALLPLEKAIEYNENTVEAGNHQGLWVTFKTDKDTAPGLYEGAIEVQVGSTKYDVKVNLNVVDYYLSPENTAKSVFPIERSSLIYGELDNTMDMYTKYVDFLLDYRMAAYKLPGESKNIEEYITQCKKYAADERCPSYTIPVYYVYNSAVGDTDLDYQWFHDYLMAMARESIKSGIDLVSKAYTYVGMIDEPETNGIVNRAIRICDGIKDMREKCALELLADSTLDAAKRQEYAEKLRGINNLMTNKKVASLDGHVDSWVPLFDDFDSINRREEYKEGDANTWWYGCIGPKHPYPTYHIDDNLISSRILSWMQYDYEIAGNLYWETALYVKAIVDDNGQYVRIPCNPYDEASRFPNVNGDGFLIYPGAPYGIDGPVASIRMHSIRDGLEEYELLKDLEEINAELAEGYGKKAMHKNELLELVFRSLYEGTKVIGGSDEFFEARHTLLNLLTLAKSDAGLFIKDVNYLKDSYEISVCTKEGFDLTVNGKAINGTAIKGGKEYKLTKENIGSGLFTLEVKNVATKASINLGGKLSVLLDGSDALAGLVSSDAYSFKVVDGSKINNALTKTATEVTLFKSAKDKVTFTIDAEGMNIPNDLAHMIAKIYNPSDDKINVQIYLQCEDDPVYKKAYAGNLKPGMNTLFINNLDRFDYEDSGKVVKIHFDIYPESHDTDTVLYLDYINYNSKED